MRQAAAGYGFARFRFRGSGIVFALVLATLMVPFQALLTPLFLEMHSLGLTNNHRPPEASPIYIDSNLLPM